jgi:hypothetical protein
MTRRGAALRYHAQRKAWIIACGIAGLPGLTDDVTDAQHVRLDALRREMFAVGLFRNGTLVSELRGEHHG